MNPMDWCMLLGVAYILAVCWFIRKDWKQRAGVPKG